MTDLPSGTVTFLFTDIEGSTRRWEEQREAMAAALQRHDEIVRSVVESRDGFVFKTVGDAFCVAYSDPLAAAESAIDVQRALAAEPWEAFGDAFDALRVRMAIHTGVAVPRDEDYLGPALSRVERLLAAGHGGQVLMSAAAAELVRDSLPEAIDTRDLGEHRLKDLTRPTRIFQLWAPGLAVESRPLRTLDAAPNNLPLSVGTFVGRAADLAALEPMIAPGSLVTLTGVGGVGKTRLALPAAAAAVDEFPDGVWLVELTAIVDGSLVPHAVAQVLGLREEKGRSVEEALADHLQERQALLVLDNCEHLLDPVAELLAHLLRRCARLAVLVTSRERLSVGGETRWHVRPLGVPDRTLAQPAGRRRGDAATPLGVDGGELARQIAESESVGLFVDRAAAARPGFELDETSAPIVADICRRLDGIPLAIELAAARVKTLPVSDLAQRLEDRFRLLTSGQRGGPAHHQTLEAAIDWSHDLLAEPERQVLRRLAVFRGGWTLAAAEAVLTDGDIDEWALLDHLGRLIDSSLVEMSTELGEARYWLLESVRAYAKLKLEASGDGPDTERRHAEHYRDMVVGAQAELLGADQSAWLDRLERDHDNVRAVLDRATRSAGQKSAAIPDVAATGPGASAQGVDPEVALELAAAAWRFWLQRGHIREGRARLLELMALPACAGSRHTAAALHASGTLAYFQGDLDDATSELAAAIPAWEGVGDDAGAARSLNNLALAWMELGDYDRARTLQSQSLAIWERLGDESMSAILAGNLAHLSIVGGDLTTATQLLRDCLPRMQRLGNQTGASDVLFHLGYVAQLQGRLDESERFYDQCLGLRTALEDRVGVSAVRRNLADLAMGRGDLEGARRGLTECLELDRALGDAQAEAETLSELGRLHYLAGDLGEAESRLAQALAVQESIGHKRGIGDTLDRLARVAARSGDVLGALEYVARSLEARRELRHWHSCVGALETCAMVEALAGRTEAAVAHARRAQSERDRTGAPLSEAAASELASAFQAAGRDWSRDVAEGVQSRPDTDRANDCRTSLLAVAIEEAHEQVEAALREARESGGPRGEPPAHHS